jgi:hypothetical protein
MTRGSERWDLPFGESFIRFPGRKRKPLNGAA